MFVDNGPYQVVAGNDAMSEELKNVKHDNSQQPLLGAPDAGSVGATKAPVKDRRDESPDDMFEEQLIGAEDDEQDAQSIHGDQEEY